MAPGAIVGVTVGDRTWKSVRGSTRRGAKVRPRLGDHTRIGSLTKTFVATLILQLADDGKLKLTDTIDNWVPWVPNASQITVRDLGDMGSGINTYTADQGFLDAYFANPRAAWTPIEVIKDGVSLPPKFAPGQGFFYSNTNFLLLAKIAEKVTGKPIGRLLRERIFDPLGMTHTSYPYTTALPAPSWNGYTNQDASGTGDKIFDATHWNPTPFGAAGQIVSNLADMQIWAKAIGTGSLLTKAGHRAQLTANPLRGQRAEKVRVRRRRGQRLDHPRRHRPRLQLGLRLPAEAGRLDRRPHQHRHRSRAGQPALGVDHVGALRRDRARRRLLALSAYGETRASTEEARAGEHPGGGSFTGSQRDPLSTVNTIPSAFPRTHLRRREHRCRPCRMTYAR